MLLERNGISISSFLFLRRHGFCVQRGERDGLFSFSLFKVEEQQCMHVCERANFKMVVMNEWMDGRKKGRKEGWIGG